MKGGKIAKRVTWGRKMAGGSVIGDVVGCGINGT